MYDVSGQPAQNHPRQDERALQSLQQQGMVDTVEGRRQIQQTNQRHSSLVGGS